MNINRVEVDGEEGFGGVSCVQFIRKALITRDDMNRGGERFIGEILQEALARSSDHLSAYLGCRRPSKFEHGRWANPLASNEIPPGRSQRRSVKVVASERMPPG